MAAAHTIFSLLLKHLPRAEFNIHTAPYDVRNPGEKEFQEFLARQGHEVGAECIPWRGWATWRRCQRTVGELVRKHRIDLIHSHDNLSNALVGLGRSAWPSACVASAYGWFEPKRGVRVATGEGGWHNAAWRFRVRTYYWLDLNVSLPRFDRVYTVSEEMKRKLLRGRTEPDRIRVIRTGLALEHFSRGKRRRAVRQQLEIPDDALVVGIVGRLSGEKGHLVLVDALRILAPEFPKLRLLIVGTGYMREPIELRLGQLGLADRATVAGYVDDLPGVLDAMDIFTLPSVLEEGLPTAILEAQAAGLPVVASRIGGTHETIDEGRTGFLTISGDARSLADAIRPLAGDPAAQGGPRRGRAAVGRGAVQRESHDRRDAGDVLRSPCGAGYRDSLGKIARGLPAKIVKSGGKTGEPGQLVTGSVLPAPRYKAINCRSGSTSLHFRPRKKYPDAASSEPGRSRRK